MGGIKKVPSAMRRSSSTLEAGAGQFNSSQKLILRIWLFSVVLALVWMSTTLSSPATVHEHAKNHDYDFGWLPQQLAENYDDAPFVRTFDATSEPLLSETPVNHPEFKRKPRPELHHLNLNSTLLKRSRASSGNSSDCPTELHNVTLVPLKITEFRFLHVGKAGGGTVLHHLKYGWGFAVRGYCHPYASRCFKKARSWMAFQYRPQPLRPYILVTLRDPIDRFKSAFDWRYLLACKPNDSRREHQGYSTHFPTKFCQRLQQEEWNALEKYHGSSNAFGEALCSIDSTNNSTTLNPSVAEQIRTIHHLNDSSIALWLGEASGVYNWRENLQNLLPVILEKGFDLAEAIDQSLLHASSLSQSRIEAFRNVTNFDERYQRARCYELSSAKKALAVSHSAAAHHDAVGESVSGTHHSMSKSSQHTKSSLSREAQICIAKYYERDYQILAELSEKCETSICRAAIQSILKRRADVLPDSIKRQTAVS